MSDMQPRRRLRLFSPQLRRKPAERLRPLGLGVALLGALALVGAMALPFGAGAQAPATSAPIDAALFRPVTPTNLGSARPTPSFSDSLVLYRPDYGHSLFSTPSPTLFGAPVQPGTLTPRITAAPDTSLLPRPLARPTPKPAAPLARATPRPTPKPIERLTQRTTVAPVRGGTFQNIGGVLRPAAWNESGTASWGPFGGNVVTRWPVGTPIKVCAHESRRCWSGRSYGYGPAPRIFPERIADLDTSVFADLCGSPSRGICSVTVTRLH